MSFRARCANQPDFRIPFDAAAGLDRAQDLSRLPAQPREIHLFAHRLVPSKLAQGLSKLARGSLLISSRVMVKPDRDVDQSLQEQPPRTAFRRPRLLEYFVAFEVMAAVEQLDAALEQ